MIYRLVKHDCGLALYYNGHVIFDGAIDELTHFIHTSIKNIRLSATDVISRPSKECYFWQGDDDDLWTILYDDKNISYRLTHSEMAYEVIEYIQGRTPRFQRFTTVDNLIKYESSRLFRAASNLVANGGLK